MARPSWFRFFLVLPAFVLMLGGLTAPLGGSHAFRQAHVAANIEMLVRGGFSLYPSTYNEEDPDAPAFDVPLYQLVVAGACRLVPAEPLRVARAVNLAFFAVLLLVLDRLLAQVGIRRSARVAALCFFAYAPLALFYFQVPFVDGLALLLALLSLQQYVSLETRGARTRARVTQFLAAFLSTLIKSPVYLPVLIAILWHRVRSRGFRGLVEAETIPLLAAPGLALLLFKVYWMAAGADPAPVLSSWERQHYFGTLAERFSVAAWRPVAWDLARWTASPVVLALAVGGLVLRARRPAGPMAPVFTGLLVGGAVTLLVFFHLYRPHNYYQLPLVFPMALFGALGLEEVQRLARARRWPAPVRRAAGAALPIALLATVLWGWAGLQRLATPSESTRILRSRGDWIRERTGTDDYVIYAFPSEGHPGSWNPLYLYFAGRRGYNLASDDVRPERLAAIRALARGRFARVLAFSVRDDTHRILEGVAGEPLATGGRRALFQLDPVRPPRATPAPFRSEPGSSR